MKINVEVLALLVSFAKQFDEDDHRQKKCNMRLDSFDVDYGMATTRIGSEAGKVHRAIEALLNCLEKSKEIINLPTDNGNVIAAFDISEELAKPYVETTDNIQNEIFYNSLFIITTSFLEFSLTELCRTINSYIEGAPNSYKGYNGNGIGLEKSKNYLKEFLQINIGIYNEWSKIQVNSKIRNLIIHNGGNIITDDTKYLSEQADFEELNKNTDLTIIPTGYVFIKNADYIRESFRLEYKFLNEVISEVEKKLKP